jgi:hypothetical protein
MYRNKNPAAFAILSIGSSAFELKRRITPFVA